MRALPGHFPVSSLLPIAMLRQLLDVTRRRAGIDGFVAGHDGASEANAPRTLDIPDGSQQNAPMRKLFLQLR
jgi:hypothetical protein